MISYFSKLQKSTILAIGLIFIILVFSILYLALPEDSWYQDRPINDFGDALYFSVVTITTLGFGDIFPLGCLAKIFVCLEVLLGVFMVGFYLNEVSREQADEVNRQSEERNTKERKSIALARLVQNRPLIIPKIDQYILACYEVVTPQDKRKFEEIQTGFEVKYNNMYDLYGHSFLMTNPFNKPLIDCFFERMHSLETELRFALSNNDLSHWTEMRDSFFDLVAKLSTFEYEQAILHAEKQYVGGDKSNPEKITDYISKVIRESEAAPEFSPSNMFNAYRALYDLICDSLTLTINLKRQLNNIQ